MDEAVNDVGVHLSDGADSPWVDPATALRLHSVDLLRANETVVFAGEADRAAAVRRDEGHDLLIELPAEHHLDDVHRVVIGDS